MHLQPFEEELVAKGYIHARVGRGRLVPDSNGLNITIIVTFNHREEKNLKRINKGSNKNDHTTTTARVQKKSRNSCSTSKTLIIALPTVQHITR